MAGGIFPNYPFELNPKCIIFSIFIIGLFFYKPPELHIYWKLLIAFILFVLSYVSLAWYDYTFDCTTLALKKSSSPIGITGLFKPPDYTPSQTDKSKLTKNEKDLEWVLVNLFHLVILAPLFLYVGTYKQFNIDDSNDNSITNILLIAVFAFAILYHGVRVIEKINIISITHIIVGIIGIYYSAQTEKPKWFYNVLSAIGVYAGLKHGYYLTQTFH